MPLFELMIASSEKSPISSPMKTARIFIVGTILTSASFSVAAEKCELSAFSKGADAYGIGVFDKPGGKALTQIPDATRFTVVQYKDDWFEVKDFVYEMMNDGDEDFAKRKKHKITEGVASVPGIKGWVHRKHVDVHLGVGSPVDVKEDSTDNAKSIMVVSHPDKPSEIHACSGKYLRISIRGRKGWIQRFCGQPLVHCP